MSLFLHVDGPRWRAHLRSVAEREPGLVPVAKGNGYGFGLGRLARRTQWLGVPMLAVGTYDEIAAVASRFDGSIMVLSGNRVGLGVGCVGAGLEPDRRRCHFPEIVIKGARDESRTRSAGSLQ